MKKKYLAIFLGAFLVSSVSYGQKNTLIGMTGSLNYDHYDFDDQGNALKGRTLPSGSWGFIAGQEISKHLFIETGIMRKTYTIGYILNMGSFFSHSNHSFGVWQIPFLFKLKRRLLDDSVFILPRIGVNYCVKNKYVYGGAGNGSNGEDTYEISFTDDVNLSRTYILLESGIELEFNLFKKISLTSNVNYLKGFKKTFQVNYNHSINDGANQSAFARSHGDYWKIGFGVNYQISPN